MSAQHERGYRHPEETTARLFQTVEAAFLAMVDAQPKEKRIQPAIARTAFEGGELLFDWPDGSLTTRSIRASLGGESLAGLKIVLTGETIKTETENAWEGRTDKHSGPTLIVNTPFGQIAEGELESELAKLFDRVSSWEPAPDQTS